MNKDTNLVLKTQFINNVVDGVTSFTKALLILTNVEEIEFNKDGDKALIESSIEQVEMLDKQLKEIKNTL